MCDDAKQCKLWSIVQSQEGDAMLISELAQRTGLSIDTIRFYEKQGLLDETHYERSENRYRHYSEAGLQRLNLIKMGQLTGFTLNEMRHAIRAWETDELSPTEKEHYLCLKLEQIEQKIQALNAMKALVTEKLEYLHEGDTLSMVEKAS